VIGDAGDARPTEALSILTGKAKRPDHRRGMNVSITGRLMP
jgi:hypothetical protein